MFSYTYHVFIFVILISCISSVVCEPFPNDIVDGTVTLLRGHTYRITETIEWIGSDRIIVYGNGAKIIIDKSMREEIGFFFKGKRWIWESVHIEAESLESVMVFDVEGNGGLLQLRGCTFDTKSRKDIVISGIVDTVILHNNKFKTNAFDSVFLSYDTSIRRLNWRSNSWEGNYTISVRDLDMNSIVERNSWKVKSVSERLLDMGEFRHEDGETWCVPPQKWNKINSTYYACSNRWFLESIGKIPKLNYLPMKSISGDVKIPSSLVLQGEIDMDLGGNEIYIDSITALVGTRLKITGMNTEKIHKYLQITTMHNSTVEFEEVNFKGPDRRIECTMSTESSHVFFMRSSFEDIEIVGSGLGHMHVQHSTLKDFILTSPSIWSSRNEGWKDSNTTLYWTHEKYFCKRYGISC